MHFSAGSAVFGTAGTVDLTSATPAVSATSSAKTVTVQFATAKTTDVTARFVLLPLNCIDVDFNMHVEFEDGFYETFAIGSKTLDIAAGVRKSNTWTLGTGVMSNAPWGWYFVASGTNIGTAISAAKTALGSNDVKLYLESSPSESMNYATTARIYPTGSIWIDSNPANMKPTIEQGAVTFFEPKKDATIETLSVKNVNLYAKDALSDSYLFYISSTEYTGVSVGSLEFDNCTFSNYKHSFVRIVSGLSSGARIGRVSMNNCVHKVKSTYSGAVAFVHLSNNLDRVYELSITNCTFEGMACFLYHNLSSGNQESPFVLTFENNTVANTKTSSSNKYFFNIQNAISGTTSIRNNLFVGSNGNDGLTYRMIKEGNTSKFTNTFSNNWYAPDWLNFTVDSGSGCLNFLTNDSASNSAALCPGAGSSDFTVSTSDVKTASAGDPRWL